MLFQIFILLVMFFGIILITINIVKHENKCPKKKIEYRYIPKTFEDEQLEPVYVSDIFKTMFSQQSPWIFSIQNMDRNKQESINKFFISQY